MRKWWRSRREEPAQKPPAPPPPSETEISLPDPDEAREALAHSKETKRRADELSAEIKEMLRLIRAAREENNFAEGIVEMIKRGR